MFPFVVFLQIQRNHWNKRRRKECFCESGFSVELPETMSAGRLSGQPAQQRAASKVRRVWMNPKWLQNLYCAARLPSNV